MTRHSEIRHMPAIIGSITYNSGPRANVLAEQPVPQRPSLGSRRRSLQDGSAWTPARWPRGNWNQGTCRTFLARVRGSAASCNCPSGLALVEYPRSTGEPD
jgi:hypothetical protein